MLVMNVDKQLPTWFYLHLPKECGEIEVEKMCVNIHIFTLSLTEEILKAWVTVTTK